MIEEVAYVIAIKGHDKLGHSIVTLESQTKSSCSSCNQIENCGSGQISKAIPRRKILVDLTTSLPVKVGDALVLGLSEKSLLKVALQVYLWPLLGLILSSALGQWLVQNNILPSEPYAIFIGIIGGYIGYRFAKYRQQDSKQSAALTPKILRIQS
jgi:sigma-E factor negative regulatory protein RseC